MSLVSIERALQLVLTDVSPLPGEPVELAAAAGRILAKPLVAKLTQPPFAASAMDGYACRAGDLTAQPGTPCRLRIIGQSAAGHPFAGTVGPGEAIRIFTGAPLAAGTDTVIMQENTVSNGSTASTVCDDTASDGSQNHVIITDCTISPGFVRPRGMDFRQGDELLPAGRKLGPGELALAAAMGHGTVELRQRPSIAILSTGDELVPPGTTPGPGQIISSNHLGIAALAQAAGGSAHYLGIARDTMDSLNEHLDRAGSADIVVTIGGASVGDHDLVAPVLQARGMDLSFWKIAMRPGKPIMFGRHGGGRIIGLPGNPISSLIGARIFLVPLIRALLGLPPQDQRPRRALLAAPLAANGPRQHYIRAVQTIARDGTAQITPLPAQDSSLLSAFTRSDCLIVHPPHAGEQPKGSTVQVLDFEL